MKKIILIILMSFMSLLGYSQLNEGFEGTAIPDASGVWTLGSGAWKVFDNGVGTAQSWGVTSTAANVYQGTNAAEVLRGNIGAGNTSEDWLVTPLQTVPTNGQLRFFTRAQLTGGNGTIYQIRISSTTATSQTDVSSYTIIKSYTELELAAIQNEYEEKTISLSAYAGQSRYIAFVRVNTQVNALGVPVSSATGDKWLVDRVRIVQQCLNPTILTATSITPYTANLGWTNTSGATLFNIEYGPSGFVLGTGTQISVTTNPYQLTFLTPATAYQFYVTAICNSGPGPDVNIDAVPSGTAGPFNFLTSPLGSICSDPIAIPSLPYQVISDNTFNYGDDIDPTGGAVCGATYLAGDEVFYSYTAATTGLISITMTPQGTTSTNSSLFVYNGCTNVGVSCLAGVANTGVAPRVINLTVTAGQTYIIVISSSAATQSITYGLVIQNEDCLPKPTGLGASLITMTTASLGWTSPTSFSSWEVAVQPLGSLIPSGAGEAVTANPFVKTGLTAGTQYQYWVRSECTTGSGIFSAWSGPFPFNTQICEDVDKCNYVFRMTDSANNGWNGAVMQVRQGGIVVGTIGSTYNSGAGPVNVSVALCKNVPFDLFWITNGTQPQQCIVTIINSFGQTLFTKAAGVGTAGDIVYTNTVNCDTPICDIVPTNVQIVAGSITTTSVQVSWTSPSLTSWDVYVVPSGSAAPVDTTVPTYSDVTNNVNFLVSSLLPDHTYDIYVRSACTPKSAWSLPKTVTTLPTCFKPTAPVVVTASITMNSATFTWVAGTPTDTQWEMLLIPGPNPPAVAPDNTTPATYTNVTSPFTPTNLQAATIYYAYVRTVCSTTDSSTWTPFTKFNTVTCAPADKCNYKFVLTNAVSSTWNGARMQVRQNGIVIQTLGAASINAAAGVSVPLCPGVPFDLYWSVPGTTPELVSVSIQNPFLDVLYTKAAGQGNPLEVLYSSVGNCTPAACSKPTALLVTAGSVTQTSAELSWTEIGTSTQWEVYAVPVGSPTPVNGIPVTGTGSYHIVNALPYTITGLIPGTAYVYYVRAICSSTETSTWTILTPKTFTTKPINDECAFAVTVPVNPTQVCATNIAGNTLGATLSTPTITGTGCGTTDDDVWYSFTATNNIHIINLNTIAPTPTTATVSLNHTLFSGTCNALVKIYCSTSSESVATGLIPGQTYIIRVYTAGTTVGQSASFNICIKTPPPPATNDECATAIVVPVNANSKCVLTTAGNIIGATASTVPNATPVCTGNANDDVWFSFVASSTQHIISLLNVTGTTTDLNHAVYSGTCGSLVRKYCSTAASLTSINATYVVGQTYYLRVWSNSATSQVTTFDVCIKSVSTCENTDYFCGSSPTNPFIYENTTGVTPGAGQIACLFSTPNPTYYTLHVGATGPLFFNILQNTQFDPITNNPVGTNLDVDFVAWGPFSDTASCSQIATGPCSPVPCPNNNTNPTFYPLGNIVDCSYSGSFTETLSIPNAQAGQYYVILVTNFNGAPGFIRLVQTNFSEPTAGETICCSVALGPDKSLCATSVTLNALEDVVDLANVPSTFEWFFNGSTTPIAGATSATYEATESGIYQVKGACGINPVHDEITVLLGPIINTITPSNYVVCDDATNDGLATFDLTTLNSQVLGTLDPLLYNVTYHITPTEAAGDVGAIDTSILFHNTVPYLQIIYIRVESKALSTCFDVVPVNLVVINLPIANFTYSAVAYCKNGINPLPILSGTVGTFSYVATPATAVLAINTTTGEIDLASSSPGDYMVTNTIFAANGCSDVFSLAVHVIITELPIATFSYEQVAYCKNGINPSPILTGVAGIFSATPAGLVIDPATGVLNLAASSAGIYTINNKVLAAAGCDEVNEYTQLTVTALPDATFTYTAPAYCKDGINPLPQFTTGTVSGQFSASPAGISINALTGEIDLANSNAGTYSVINTVLAANGCADVSSLPVIVVITELPIAVFNYDQASYCIDATNPSPILTGVSGVFSATPAGLVIDPVTGVVNLAASSEGTYTVNNKVLAAAGCNEVNETTQIAIKNLPKANFSYDAPAYCKDGTNPILTFSPGAIAGAFYYSASPTAAVLAINTATGAIDLATSSPGDYIIYNTILPIGGCSTVISLAVNLKITAPTVATFNYGTGFYCKEAGSASPTFVGTAIAGQITAVPSGLSINASTGVVNLAASTAGTYTVTNTISPFGGCSGDVKTASITITAPATGTISYNSPFCISTTGTQNTTVTNTAPAGGTYSSTSGLSLNTVTGAINPALSNAGDYVVTYKILAALGCGDFSITAPVEIIHESFVEFTSGCNSNDYLVTALPSSNSFDPLTATYAWSGPSFQATAEPNTIALLANGTYTVTITTGDGCVKAEAITINDISCEIQKGISPNNDTKNNSFDLTALKVKHLAIYNRYGTEVYQLNNYTDQWVGQSTSGNELPDGTYYYVIKKQDGKNITGWVYINREIK